MASNLVCPLEAPFYYTTTLHLICACSLPMNLLAIYFIAFQSPKMGKYKLCLAYLLLAAFIVEVWMSWVCPGYYYFPMLGGYNTNSFSSKYISTHASCVFYFFVFCFEMPAMLVCFEYRFHAARELQISRNTKKAITYLAVLFAHTFPFVTAVCLINSELTKEEQYEIVKKFYPNCVSAVYRQGFLIYDFHTNPWTLAVGVATFSYIALFTIYTTTIATRTCWILQKLKAHMSIQTYKMHRAAFVSLTLQCIVPVICLFIPLAVIFIVVFYDLSELREMTTDTMFMITAHSMASSCVLIITNQRYRNLLIAVFVKKLSCLRMLQSISTVERTASVAPMISGALISRAENRTF